MSDDTRLDDLRALLATYDNPNGALSFEELERQWQPLLYRFSVQKGVAGMEVEDVYQELLVTLWKVQQRWRPNAGASFKTWVWRAFSNRLMNLRKGVTGRQHRIQPSMLVRISDDPEEGGLTWDHEAMGVVDGGIVRAEELATLGALLSSLSSQARSLVTLVLDEVPRSQWPLRGQDARAALEEIRAAMLKGGIRE